MLMMHTKNQAIQMITRLSDPVNGLEIWRRFLEEWHGRVLLGQVRLGPGEKFGGQVLLWPGATQANFGLPL